MLLDGQRRDDQQCPTYEQCSLQEPNFPRIRREPISQNQHDLSALDNMQRGPRIPWFVCSVYKRKPWFPNRSVNIHNQMPQINFNREEDKDAKANPGDHNHNLSENNVLSPHGIIFAPKEGGCWVIEIQRDVRDDHPCNEWQLGIKRDFDFQGGTIHVIGEAVCQKVGEANCEAEHNDNCKTKSPVSQSTPVVPVGFPKPPWCPPPVAHARIDQSCVV